MANKKRRKKKPTTKGKLRPDVSETVHRVRAPKTVLPQSDRTRKRIQRRSHGGTQGQIAGRRHISN